MMLRMTTTLLVLFALNATAEEGSGLYLGAGGGFSSYRALFVTGDYYVDDEFSGSTQTRGYNEWDGGYRIYAGYLFNRVFGIEGAYTDYGTLASSNYSQKPFSASLCANAGYSFMEGQLRPFGLLGLAYVKTNQSRNLLDEELPALHLGGGVDYYPPSMKGLGFRAALDADLHISHQSMKDPDGNTSLRSFYQHYLLLYAGVQYRF